MDIKKIVLIAAAAGSVALTGCAARSEYYGVFVAERTDREAWSDHGEPDTYYSEITAEVSESSDAVSMPEYSVTSTPAAPTSKSPETSATPPASSATTPQTTPEPQTTQKPQSTPAPRTTTSAPSTTPSAPAPQTTPSTPAAPSAPSTQSTPPTTPQTHAPSTNPINPATAHETTAGTKAATTTATVAAAVDEPVSADEYIAEVLRLVNVERADEGLSPLVLDSKLSEAARVRAEEQIELFGHTRPDGQSCFTVFKEYGINYSTAGENAAAGYSTPEDVVKAWMSSDGHRANILKPCFEKLGVGFVYSDDSYGAYWVQLFIEE